MIAIKEKKNCCGCGACMQVCPKMCIEMNEDEEGFLYPQVCMEKCVNCGLCEKICPMLNKVQKSDGEPKVYAAYNLNKEERMQSSSGAIFSLLAENILLKDGVVYGVKMSDDCYSAEFTRVTDTE